MVLASPRLRSAEARALNPRKVLLRVDLAVDITACQPLERPICSGVTGGEEEGLCQRQYRGEHYQLSAVQEKPFTFSDQVRLQGMGESPMLLSTRVQPVCSESKLIGSKLIFKGMVEVDLLLQETGGTLSAAHESMPFSQIIETAGAGEEGDCQVEVEVASLQCDQLPGDGRELDVTLELLAQARVYSRRPVTLLQDLYSTSSLMEVERENQPLCSLTEQSVRPQAVRELLETGVAVRSVVDTEIGCGGAQLSGGELKVPVWARCLYLDENDVLGAVHREFTVSLPTDLPQEGEAPACQAEAACHGDVIANIMPEGIELRFPLECALTTSFRRRYLCISGAETAEEEGDRAAAPSLILRKLGTGESLWSIAKQYRATREGILAVNELSDESQIPPDRLLLIPKAR